jgi:DNA-binding response OmpR family regulator
MALARDDPRRLNFETEHCIQLSIAGSYRLKGAPVDDSIERRPDDPNQLVPIRILVVEDRADTADSMAKVLRAYGHEVQIAPDGHRALALAEAMQPDAVLLDIGLPGMSGYEVARTLRAQTKRRILLIAITGYGVNAEERLTSYEVGIDLHLTKPVAMEEVEYYLERCQAVMRRRA